MTESSGIFGDRPAQVITPTGVPLYKQAKRLIVQLLSAGEWPQGEALPSEAHLSARFGVSPGTVRKAIAELVVERVLVRHQGLGTFVPARNQDYMLDAFFHIHDRSTGKKEFPRTELINLERIRGEKGPASALGLRQTECLIKFKNLLYLSQRPVILDVVYVPQALFPDLNESVLRDRTMTIFGIYQTKYRITVARVKEWISAARPPREVARRLKLVDLPVLAIERTGFTYEGRPVEYRLRYVNSEKHAYLNELGMKQ